MLSVMVALRTRMLRVGRGIADTHKVDKEGSRSLLPMMLGIFRMVACDF